MGVSLEWVAMIDCAAPGRLAAAERLVSALPAALGGGLRECDLAYEAVGSWFAAVVRLAPGPAEADHARRLRFWCERAGAEVVALGELADPERIALRARIALSGRVARAVRPEQLAPFAYGFFADCGAPAARRRPGARPVLALGAASADGLRWSPGDRALFVAGALAPLPGDELQVALQVDGSDRPLECAARVRDVRAPEAAAPGLPAGFTLQLHTPPPALVHALRACAPETTGAAPARPLAPAPPFAAPLRAANAAPAGRRALVVDDDAFARQLLGDALAALGFEVLTASDGHAGLRRLADEVAAVDLLVTDVRMPGMDGGTLVRTVRRGGEAELAVVVVTGSPDAAAESALERDGADAVLDKALGAEIIARAAEAVVRRKRVAA